MAIVQRRIPLVVGGCAYRLGLRVEHAASLAQFAACIAVDDMEAGAMDSSDRSDRPSFEIASVDYQHTSNLPQGRCQWLARAVAFTSRAPLALAVSIDSDTSFHAFDLMLDLPVVLAPDVAIGCVPIRVGGTSLCNLNVTAVHGSRGRTVDRMAMEKLGAVLEGNRNIESGGFGLAVFNMTWFRTHWPEPEPVGIGLNVGEDIAMCRAVRERGGRVVALRVRAQHHEFRA